MDMKVIDKSVDEFYFFFFNDTATTEIYTLSLHDALPICGLIPAPVSAKSICQSWPHNSSETVRIPPPFMARTADRKSTRLNSSHSQISYAVFCLKKKH